MWMPGVRPVNIPKDIPITKAIIISANTNNINNADLYILSVDYIKIKVINMEKLHPGAKWLFRLRVYSFLFGLLWILFFLFVGSFGKDTGAPIFDIIGYIIVFLIPLIAVLIIIGEIYARLSYRFWGYEFTKDELKIEKGIIWKTYKSIPYGRVQNIDIKRGVIARILGFSTIEIQTAGYSAIQTNGRSYGAHSEGYLPAVSIEEGEKIRSNLVKRIGKRQGL
jgi:membrane protein YdbS with pleckstrin-like domain